MDGTKTKTRPPGQAAGFERLATLWLKLCGAPALLVAWCATALAQSALPPPEAEHAASGTGPDPGGFGFVGVTIIALLVLLIAGLVITRLKRRPARNEELRLPRRGPGRSTDTEQ